MMIKKIREDFYELDVILGIIFFTFKTNINYKNPKNIKKYINLQPIYILSASTLKINNNLHFNSCEYYFFKAYIYN